MLWFAGEHARKLREEGNMSTPGKTRTITLRSDQWELAELIAKEKGSSVDDVIDRVLEAGLAKLEPRSAMKCGALPAHPRGKSGAYLDAIGPCQRVPGHKGRQHEDAKGRRFVEVTEGTAGTAAKPPESPKVDEEDELLQAESEARRAARGLPTDRRRGRPGTDDIDSEDDSFADAVDYDPGE